jgi:hypothetical protein
VIVCSREVALRAFSIVWIESSNCLQMVHQKNALLGALCIFVTKLGNLVFFEKLLGRA